MIGLTPVCLIVEDAEVDRRMMRRVILQQWPNLRLAFAHTLAEARKKLAEDDVRLIFLDNMLPDGNGVDFLAELSGKDAWSRLPVVIVSDWPSPFMYAKAQAANVCDVWSKNDFRVPQIRRVLEAHALVA